MGGRKHSISEKMKQPPLEEDLRNFETRTFCAAFSATFGRGRSKCRPFRTASWRLYHSGKLYSVSGSSPVAGARFSAVSPGRLGGSAPR